MQRTRFGLASAAALLLALGAGSPVAFAQADPIRMGFLTVRTGALAAGGKQMEQGIELFLKQRNNMIAGRKVELFIADTGGNPAGTKTKTQELVERNNVHVILGPLAAFEAIAIDDYIRQTQTPIVSCSAAADDLTQRKPNPWFVRSVASSSQPYFPLGDYAARTLGYKRVAIIADDFAYGYETAGGFQRGFEDAGGKIVQKLWPPLNVADYGSYIVQIKTDVDAIWVGFAGANGLRFLKQYKDYGMKIPVLGSMTSTDEGILRRMGDEALGVVTSGWYAAGLESPENDAFVAAVNKAYGADPGYYTLGCYSAGALVEAAARAIGGRVEDKVALMKALRNPGTVKDARGEWRIDEFGNPVMPIHIRKVERKNGKLVNAVVKTYPGVSQFWTYDPKQYIANPSYSRDYPPAKFLGQ